MLKINHKNHDIRIIGDSDTLKTEIGTLMLALCGEAAKQSKKAAADIFDSYLKTLAGIAAYLKREHHIDVKELLDEEPEVTITYFEPDKKKSGGAYVNITGIVKRIDEYEHFVIMTDGKKIRIEDIFAIGSDLFYSLGLEE